MAVIVPAAPTIGEIARRLGVAVHRVEYVIRTRNLRPAARAGNIRVFSETDVAYVASEVRRIDADRERTAL